MSSSNASNEGVQNDFLPLLDGTDVPVKEGSSKYSRFNLNTRNMLFVALGAFSKNKPSDLIVEIQGRLPIVCKVDSLTPQDFKNILLKSKENALHQITKMLKAEDISLKLTDDALDEICEIAHYINQTQDDTGARRLVSVLHAVTEEMSFLAPDIYSEYSKENKELVITLDRNFIRNKCDDIIKGKKELKKYVL